jgi:hypothetical protein
MYRVSWKNDRVSGSGEYTSKVIAKSWVDAMNKKYGRELVHWVEKKPGLKRLLTWTTTEIENKM